MSGDGQLRQSQVLTTFGPGAMVDLPTVSVIVGGLELWRYPNDRKQRIHEHRLEQRLAEILERQEVALYAPPAAEDDPSAPYKTGIDVFRFPNWFVAQVDESYRAPDGREYRTRPLVHARQLVGEKYEAPDRKRYGVVPVRFVRACRKGHIDDVDWRAFVGAQRTAQLWLDEGGSGNDFAEIFVRDGSTNGRRLLANATVPGLNPLGFCSGRRPWLGAADRENCTQPSRLLTRSASNAWFSQTLTVISIPDADEALRQAVDRVYDTYLSACEKVEDLAYERRRAQVKAALEGISDSAVWAEVQRRKSGFKPQPKSIKQAEIETLLMQPVSGADSNPRSEFFARTRPLGHLPPGLAGKLDKVVLVHRLREVICQLGFTRFEPAQPDINGELELGVERAPLAAELPWLPALENRGEGVFLSFSPAAVHTWLQRAAPRGQQLDAGYRRWLQAKGMDQQARWVGLPYVMLHSLSHLLITAMSLECGYAASSIRERIYAGDSGYGILLYTGGAGAEGTLGGLVQVGRKVEHHLARAFDLSRLCSNDPVCAQHHPDDRNEERFLHGAACHGCLLISETSCESRNEHLDRALVFPTLAMPEVAFFGGTT